MLKDKYTTKDKILATALTLFNQHGTESITVRHIAKEMGISHGNLCYHFATKEDIIYKLYEKLASEFDQRMYMVQAELNFAVIIESTRFAIEVFYKYKFLMIDFVSILRKIEKIKIHYIELTALRNKQFKQLFQMMAEAGYMKTESYPGEFDALIENWTIMGDSWIAHSEIHFKGTEKEKIEHYNRLLLSSFYPYLTQKGTQMAKKLLF